jgi:hypothetical protein
MKWCMVINLIIRGLAGQFLIDSLWKLKKNSFGTAGLRTRHVLEHIGTESW